MAGADEAGRGPLAGPLVVAGVLFDLDELRGARARPLAYLNDSKQVGRAGREALYRAILACAERVSVHVVPSAVIDRDGLHASNLRMLREALWACQPADVSLVDGFKLGPAAPPHRAVVDGDTKSAAVAAASIVAKVTRDRYMRAVDALYPGYGFASHVGYITPSHTAAVRRIGPCEIHRRSFQALCCYADLGSSPELVETARRRRRPSARRSAPRSGGEPRMRDRVGRACCTPRPHWTVRSGRR